MKWSPFFSRTRWEFCAAFHAATLAGAIPTLLNPTYREREVRYQLENSGAVLLITDGGNIEGMNLRGCQICAGCTPRASLQPGTRALRQTAEPQ